MNRPTKGPRGHMAYYVTPGSLSGAARTAVASPGGEEHPGGPGNGGPNATGHAPCGLSSTNRSLAQHQRHVPADPQQPHL